MRYTPVSGLLGLRKLHCLSVLYLALSIGITVSSLVTFIWLFLLFGYGNKVYELIVFLGVAFLVFANCMATVVRQYLLHRRRISEETIQYVTVAGTSVPVVAFANFTPMAFVEYSSNRASYRVLISMRAQAMLSAEELRAVIAHEIAHIIHGDMWGKWASVLFLRQWYAFGRLAECLPALSFFLWFVGLIEGEELLSLMLVSLFIIAAVCSAYFFEMAGSRCREFLADAAAVKYVGWDQRHHLINALKKMTDPRPPTGSRYIGKYARLLDSHPTLRQRTHALKLEDESKSPET